MTAIPADFLELSRDLGADPLRIQGPGGNTSIKANGVMHVKASGTELADACEQDIFVAVDVEKARAEARGAGDGTCKAAVLPGGSGLRPSIETTFHAAFDWPVVAHTHSVATLAHVVSDEGTALALEKLSDLPVAVVPYAKPGVPLTGAIMDAVSEETQIVLLRNHGLICGGRDASEVRDLVERVESALALPSDDMSAAAPEGHAPEGFEWVPGIGRLATDPDFSALAAGGSYWPDHVVFLGPALPKRGDDLHDRPCVLVEGQGIAVRTDAKSAQRAMAQCLADVLARMPTGMKPEALSPAQEAELLNWDAEKYRQALAARQAGNG
ncbi:MAG: class II aldolase/adducin family protein [Pseudomonadota bacterium]